MKSRYPGKDMKSRSQGLPTILGRIAEQKKYNLKLRK
jgi:hypothetical protein